MGVVRDRVEGVHFEGKMAPVFKKLAHHRQRQCAVAQLGHEGAFVNFLVGVFVERFVEVIDILSRLFFAELLAGLGLM